MCLTAPGVTLPPDELCSVDGAHLSLNHDGPFLLPFTVKRSRDTARELGLKGSVATATEAARGLRTPRPLPGDTPFAGFRALSPLPAVGLLRSGKVRASGPLGDTARVPRVA